MAALCKGSYTPLTHVVNVFSKPQYNKMTAELEHPWWQIILFLFHFSLLCNSLKCAGHYDSKGVCGII